MDMIKTLLTLIFLLIFSLLSFGQKTNTYIDKYKPAAVALMHEYSIPASVILGIAIIESGYGTSDVSKKLNNHFGIVGKNYNSVKKLGYKSQYKEYKTDIHSFEHFCEVISRKSFYNKLIEEGSSYKTWITYIKKSGYAASPTWAKQVLLAIDRLDLDEIDKIDPLNN